MSRYKEGSDYVVGIVCDDRGNDPQNAVRPRVHTMDTSELSVPDETVWAYCLDRTHPQIFGNNGQEFQDGEHGLGVTPNKYNQGTMLLCARGGSDGQTLYVVGGAIPTMGGGQSDS